MKIVKIITLFLLISLGFWPGAACHKKELDFTVSKQEILVTKKTRDRLGLYWWPDGRLSILAQGDGLAFLAPNSGKLAKTGGSLAEPVQTVAYTGKAILGLPDDFAYAAGGPVYQDEKTGLLLLFYHAEKNPGGNGHMFYSSIGLARSTDGGETFFDLGEIIRANLALDSPKRQGIVELGAGPFIIVDDYFQVYFRDYLADGKTVNNLATARARVTDVLAAAEKGQAAEFFKYWQGGFSQPGLGGSSSPLEKGNPHSRWFDLVYNPDLSRYIMVMAQNKITGRGTDLYLASSQDGLNWTRRHLLAKGPGESFYPSLVEAEDEEPGVYYVYYTHSLAGEWDRWSDAALVRRKIRFN